MCGLGAWDFRADGVSTAGEVSCHFSDVRTVPGGYDIDAACTSEGLATPSQVRLRFDDLSGAMQVDGGPWQTISLVQCPMTFGTPTPATPAP